MAPDWWALGEGSPKEQWPLALAGVAPWIEGLSMGLYAWVVSQAPSRGRTRGKHTDVSLPLFLSPVRKTKYITIF